MIKSSVSVDNEAVLFLEVLGPSGATIEVKAIIDTGFSAALTLPKDWINALELPYVDSHDIFLADGSNIDVGLYDAEILWDGHPRPVLVHCMEGDALVGMGLMKDFLLHLPVRIGAEFTISEIE